MKKLLMLLLLPSLGWCDSKISALPSTTTLNAGDLIPVVTNPLTTPANKAITYQNFSAGIVPVIPSSGIAFGSPTSTVTSDTSNFVAGKSKYFGFLDVFAVHLGSNPYNASSDFDNTNNLFSGFRVWNQPYSFLSFGATSSVPVASFVGGTDPTNPTTRNFTITQDNAGAVNFENRQGGSSGSYHFQGYASDSYIDLTPSGLFQAAGKGINTSSITARGLTASQCVQTDANKNLISSGGSCGGGGGGGYAMEPATVTIQANKGISGSTFSFTGPQQSTVTYGLTVGSLTFTGSGNPSYSTVDDVNTYQIVGTSVAPTAGQCLVASSSHTAIGATCATGGGSGSGTVNLGTQYQVPYYSASGSSSTLSGATNFTNDGSTITLASTTTIITNISTMTQTNVSTVTATGVAFLYTGSTLTISAIKWPNGIQVSSPSATSGGGGPAIYPSTGMPTFPYGVVTSSINASSNTVIAGSTFYQNGPILLGSSVTLSGSAGFSSTSLYGIVGSILADNAATGNVGEYISSTIAQGSSINSGANGVWADVTSISLAAGDWDVAGAVGFSQNSSVTSYIQYGVGTASGSSSTGLRYGDTQASFSPYILNGVDTALPLPPGIRMSLSGTTTIYLKAQIGITSGQPKVYGRISARRIR